MSGENTDPRAEPGIGRSLKAAREGMGLSLWQVEQETRIRSRYLRDLEREEFDVLPAVYVLGSLKTYADFLGLDGAALSRQLKASLVEPAEPDVPDQLAAIGGTRDGDDEYEAAPVPAVGFDQLFVGMGVILISILAIMTLAAAVAQGDRSPVSQVDQPSTPEPPSEVALAGNVQDEEDGAVSTAGTREDEPGDGLGDGPEASNGDERDEKEDLEPSQETSAFGDAEFVPMAPSSPSTASASAAASASPAPSAAKAVESPTSVGPTSVAPTSASAAPVRRVARPANDNPRSASAPPEAPAAAPAGPEGGGESPSPRGPGPGPISAEVDRKIDEAFRMNGLD